MKLEVKHLALYLPYRLKVLDASCKKYLVVWFTPKGQEKCVNIGDVFFEKTSIIKSQKYKPILRPLSDLTKENKDGLNYIEWLIETYYTIGVENQINRIEEDLRWLSHCDYFLVQHLIEWHFDVFGLIEKGLAIDINTL